MIWNHFSKSQLVQQPQAHLQSRFKKFQSTFRSFHSAEIIFTNHPILPLHWTHRLCLQLVPVLSHKSCEDHFFSLTLTVTLGVSDGLVLYLFSSSSSIFFFLFFKSPSWIEFHFTAMMMQPIICQNQSCSSPHHHPCLLQKRPSFAEMLRNIAIH